VFEYSFLERNTVGKVFRIFTLFEIEGLGLPC
jgi:hypothetical protein